MRIFRWDDEELIEAKHAHKCFWGAGDSDSGPTGGLGGPGGSASGGGGIGGNRGDPSHGATGHGGQGSEGGGENVAARNSCIAIGGKWVGGLASGSCKMPEKEPEKEKEAPPPAPAPSSGGGGGSSSSSSYPTNPYAGNTGNAQFDAQTTALQESISALVAAMANQQEAKIEDVSEPAPGIDSTILTPSMYDPSKEKKKKSYLTPIAVG